MTYVGQPVRRVEDYRLLRGRGRFVDDVRLPSLTFAVFVRSSRAHAEFSVDTSAAAQMPGILAVLTSQEWDAAGNGDMPMIHPMTFPDGRPMNGAPRLAFARKKVRHVGEIIAVVVAETELQAKDASEAVAVNYHDLPVVVNLVDALREDAPILHQEFGTNLQYERIIGDNAEVERRIGFAAHVTELTLTANRLSGNPLEPRAYVGHYDDALDTYTLWTTSQVPHNVKHWLAEFTLHIPEHKITVIAPDVGGGFGVKVEHYPEEAIVLWASTIVSRPVRWAATRNESFLSDVHARDHYTTCKMAFSSEGEILAMSVDTIAAAGAYEGTFSASIPALAYMGPLAGLYRNTHIYARVRVAYTNTLPIEAYRGAGLGEASSVFERLIENGAREMGIDVCEVRAKNLITPAEMPFKSPTGAIYDTGNFPALLDKLISLSRYKELRREQDSARRAGQLMGIGLSGFPELAGGAMPSRRAAMLGAKSGTWEAATVRVHPSGKITLEIGTHSQGQGHQTTFAQIVADSLECNIDDIEVSAGNTSRTPYGNGTWGDRSIIAGGTAAFLACDKVLKKAKRFAAHLLDCTEAEIAYSSAVFGRLNSNKTITFKDVADHAYRGADYPNDLELGLQETAVWDPPASVTSAAFHLAVVLVSKETGRIKIRDYFAVDDPGRVINPMIVDGQVEGGITQGLGEALLEHVVYDENSGELLSASFQDYAMPRANSFPAPKHQRQETRALSNPLGVKAGGESGTRGPPAAIVNAVVDALWSRGVRHIERPLTPYRIWSVLSHHPSE